MKLSWLLAAAILSLGWALHQHAQAGWQQASRERARLLDQARDLELEVTEAMRDRERLAKVSDRERARREAEVRVLAARLIGFSREAREREQRGEPEDPDARAKEFELLSEIDHLSIGQLELLVAELQACEEMDFDHRRMMIGFTMLRLTGENPEAALAVCLKVADSDLGSMGSFLARGSLREWATEDPQAALAWLEQHEESLPRLDEEQALQAAIAGTALADPALALRLIAERGSSFQEPATREVTAAVGEGPARDALWDELDRGDPVLRSTFLDAAVASFREQDADRTLEWIRRRNFSDDDEARIARQLDPPARLGDTDDWLDWAGGRLEGRELTRLGERLLTPWVREDHAAAGSWLAELDEPDPMRGEYVAIFSGLVAPHDAAAAARWVETLPPGDARRRAERQVLRSWQNQDPDAAARYARENGLESAE